MDEILFFHSCLGLRVQVGHEAVPFSLIAIVGAVDLESIFCLGDCGGLAVVQLGVFQSPRRRGGGWRGLGAWGAHARRSTSSYGVIDWDNARTRARDHSGGR